MVAHAFCFLGLMLAASCISEQKEDPSLLRHIPEKARFIFHRDGFIYALDATGTEAIRLTFGDPRAFEHVAVSIDHRYMVANEQLPNPDHTPGGHSRLWLYDFAKGTETPLLAHFLTAGNGGVDWDRDGFIYFSGKDTDPFPHPANANEYQANAGANDLFRVKPDGTLLQRLILSPEQGECDVSVSEDGNLLAYGTLILAPNRSEIWMAATDGSWSKKVFEGGTLPEGMVADPEFSPDNHYLVFSKVNLEVPPNFPENPAANTAHDIYTIKSDGNDLLRLTTPGPISIAPDWRHDSIVYLSVSEKEKVGSTAVITPFQPDQSPRRLLKGTNIAKWIP